MLYINDKEQNKEDVVIDEKVIKDYQNYVSIDASTKESLKKIDRPLHKDFWERFILSLKELSDKGQRTVYRLTLVKGFNVEELDNYAKLVALGNPDFIELKGVTYCGTSKGIIIPLLVSRT